MKLTRENLDNLFAAVNVRLNKGLAKGWNDWTKFAMPVISTTSLEKYPMLLATGAMREWIGERIVNDSTGSMLTVRNRDFEKTEGVSRNDLEDDTFGYFAPLWEAIGVEAGNLWGRLATEALTNPGNWADGAAFFGNRKIGKATINNAVSGALTAGNYETARARMLAFTDADGKTPLGLTPNLLIVGPAQEAAAKRIFKTDLIVDGGSTMSNIHRDEVEILVDPFLAGNAWFLACTDRGIMPVVVQKRREGTLQRWDNDADECVKTHNRCDYGIHSRGAAAAAVPALIIRGSGE